MVICLLKKKIRLILRVTLCFGVLQIHLNGFIFTTFKLFVSNWVHVVICTFPEIGPLWLSIVNICILSWAFVVCRVCSGKPLFYWFSLLPFPFQYHCFLLLLLLLPSLCLLWILIYSSFSSLLCGLDVLIFCFLIKAFNAISFSLKLF